MTEQAPLVAVASAPVPPGGGAEWFFGADGARLRAALFTPAGPVRGSVVLSPGRTEVIEKYFEVVGELNARGFAVLVHDWRGQGLSHHELDDRLKGHARGYGPFLSDYAALLAAFEARLPGPWIAVGHSMGGCLTLLALAKGQAPRFAAAVLSAPMFALQFGKAPKGVARVLTAFNLLIGRSGGYVLGDPGKPFDRTFEGNVLTHDAARFARQHDQIDAEPDLALGAPTWGWLDFAFKATGELARPGALAAVTLPVTVCSASEDALVDNVGQQAVAEALPDGRFVVVRGSAHEILMETDDLRAAFWVEFDALADRVAPPQRG
ncbi:alpha/beta fold hydrolase [Phenylobacterium sp.]|uniref:alpha/beta fold hydrolase n=1 Tax=Phenylobacterium sp. TaxID=1871053 RepID=UPI0035B4C5FB